MNDENIHIGTLLKQFFGYWKIYVPIGIICLIAAICFFIYYNDDLHIHLQCG